MRLVVDASVAIKWLVREEYSDDANLLLDGQHELYAPRLLASEAGSALWKKARRGLIERELAGVLAAAVPEIAIQWADDESISPDAVRLAIALDRSVYDCVYLALAHHVNATLVTADDRFANALAGTEHGGAVVKLRNIAAGGLI